MIYCHLGAMILSDSNEVLDEYSDRLDLIEQRPAAQLTQNTDPLFKRISMTYFDSLTMIKRLKVFAQDTDIHVLIDAQAHRYTGELRRQCVFNKCYLLTGRLGDDTRLSLLLL